MPSPQELHAHYTAELNELQDRVKEVRIKLSTLEELGATAPQQKPPASTGLQQANRRQKRGEVTEKIFSVVTNFGYGKSGEIKDVEEGLLREGFFIRGKYASQTIHKTLQRLAESGRIGAAKSGGRWIYSSKAEP